MVLNAHPLYTVVAFPVLRTQDVVYWSSSGQDSVLSYNQAKHTFTTPALKTKKYMIVSEETKKFDAGKRIRKSS